jgi:hypothetical protein
LANTGLAAVTKISMSSAVFIQVSL